MGRFTINDMNYFENEDYWPIDRSGESIFILDALRKLANNEYKSIRFPKSLCPPKQLLPSLCNASDADFLRAEEFVEWHDLKRIVSKVSCPPEDWENGGIYWTTSYDFEDFEWQDIMSRHNKIITKSNNNIYLRILRLCSVITNAIAEGHIKSFSVDPNTLEKNAIPAQSWNIRSDAVKARFSLGRFDPSKPGLASPRGPFDIFIHHHDFKQWLIRSKNKPGDGRAKAKAWVLDLAKQYPNSPPPGHSRKTIIEKMIKVGGISKRIATDIWTDSSNSGAIPTAWRKAGRRQSIDQSANQIVS